MSHPKLLSAILAVAAVSTAVNCKDNNDASTIAGKTCATGQTGQALQALGFRGSSLPPKTVALTFDDGPGDRTAVLSKYLKQEGIEAAFFVNGRAFGPGANEIMQQLVADGHIVANHTENHLSLTGLATATPRLPDPQIVSELTATDEKIAQFMPPGRMLFRPPFGDYDATTLASLANTPMNKYLGPILWDIGYTMDEAKGKAADWDCWQDGSDKKRLTMQACGDLYVTEIKRETRGVVLMHDPYYNELDPQQQGTVDMVMYIVPILKAEGFSFVRVDKVPEIAAQLPPLEPQATADGGVVPGATPGSSNPGQDTSATEPCP